MNREFTYRALLFAFCTLAASGALAQVVCDGTYDGHLQGIAVEPGNALYWSFTKTLVKTGLDGRLLKKAVVPFHPKKGSRTPFERLVDLYFVKN